MSLSSLFLKWLSQMFVWYFGSSGLISFGILALWLCLDSSQFWDLWHSVLCLSTLVLSPPVIWILGFPPLTTSSLARVLDCPSLPNIPLVFLVDFCYYLDLSSQLAFPSFFPPALWTSIFLSNAPTSLLSLALWLNSIILVSLLSLAVILFFFG